MVRVPGSSEASGFHRESTGEDVKIKQEPGIEVSATEGSTQTRRSTRSSDHQSFGRGSDEMKMKEEDREIDLEDKPQLPPRVLSGATADRSAKSDLLDENPMVKTKSAKAKPYVLVERSPDLKPRNTIVRSTTSERSTTRSMGSDVKDRQIGRTVQSKTFRPSGSKSDRSWLVEQSRPYVATPETTSNFEISTQKIKASVNSPLKEFSGKGRDEDWARSWIGKVRSAFVREQITGEEKCSVFGDLLTVPARYWYLQLPVSIQFNWKALVEEFLFEYCGHEESVDQQYYLSRKQPDENPIRFSGQRSPHKRKVKYI